MKCWICGDEGTTGEHKFKRSDLRDAFGTPTQAAPLFYRDGRRGRPIGSLNARILKSAGRLCPNCNSARTQPHDLAWERLSGWFRRHQSSIVAGAIVRANRIFPYDTAREMRNVHLYFIKLFGCHIASEAIPIDVASFANSILNGKAHPHVYLKFGSAPPVGKRIVGMSDIKTESEKIGGPCVFATWIYFLDTVAVNVMFAVDGQKRQGLVGAWHPKTGTNKIVISDFDGDR